MSSSSKNPGLVAGAAVALVLSAVLGWTLGGGKQTAEEQADGTPKSTGATARHGMRGSSGPPAAVKRELNRIRAIKAPVERMRAVIELVQTMPLDEYREWVEEGWFNYRDGFELTLFHQVGTERWKLEDPKGFVDWSRKEERGGAAGVLAKWIGGDRQRFEEYFKDQKDDQFRVQVLSAMAGEQPDFVLEKILELTSRGSSATSSQYQLQNLLQSLGSAAPDALEAALDSLPPILRATAETVLVAERLENSFATEFPALLARADGWRLLRDSASRVKGLGDKVLAQLDNLPDSWKQSLSSHASMLIYQSDARAWYEADYEGAGFTEEQARQIRVMALGHHAGKNPTEALALLEDSGLEGSQREQVIRSIFSRARNDSEQAEALLAILTTDADREAAGKVLTPAANTANLRESLKTPEAWLEKASEIELSPNNHYQFRSAIQSWDAEKISELTSSFMALEGEKKDRIAQALANSRSYSNDERMAPILGEALRHQLGRMDARAEEGAAEPGNAGEAAVAGSVSQDRQARDLTRMASQHAVHWVVRDPAGARAWVESLPESEPKLWAQKNMARAWSEYDPEAAARWVRTLPEKAREEVEQLLHQNR